ncbi:unnamed protein product [Dibothriocephalus latus]|uniref:Protein kinase domain-containing protein n=1 Tax=Dibothriocephalus latus TaxID=60516 RepID=A0A3P6QY47_DIBLA|nr:unnamed protein product [Dibothriocephalus latus]
MARAPNGKKLALTERKTNNGESFSGSAMREIAILRELKHENILTLLDVPNTKSSSELVFEYEDLKSIINGPGLHEEAVRNYFKQILSGLAYCHQNNIVHRDLRPENILITENNVIKIVGFGKFCGPHSCLFERFFWPTSRLFLCK